MTEKVLVIGARAGLLRALDKLNIPFSLWDEKSRRLRSAIDKFLVANIPQSREKVKALVQEFQAFGPYTHVIAGTESAVMAASVARRELNCRKSVHAIALRCYDKLSMKQYLQEYDVPMTPFLAYHEGIDSKEIIENLGLPFISKRRKSSGGRGMEINRDGTVLPNSLSRQQIYERYVNGQEASVESFINNGNIHFVNMTQYYEKKHINLVPSQLENSWHDQLRVLNEKIIKALKINWGMTHIEFYLTDQGVLFGEVALRPPGGYIMNLIEQSYGFNPWEALVAMELDRPFVFPKCNQQWSAADVLHPGSGVVDDIKGVDVVLNLPSLKTYKLKVKPGDHITAREGVSNEVGHIILSHANLSQLAADLAVLESNFKISLT